MPRFPSIQTAEFDHEPSMKLVVTIPALNEDKTIYQVVSGIPRDIEGVTEVEVIVVNDGSTDDTVKEALRAGAIVVSLPGKGGRRHVFRAGLERAMRRGADITVNIDGDGQFSPADVRKLIQPLWKTRPTSSPAAASPARRCGRPCRSSSTTATSGSP